MDAVQSDSARRNTHTIGDRFDVVRELGRGGFGRVLLCHDRNTDRLVALKTFQDHFLREREARELFMREGGLWIRLGVHPNIVQAYEICYDQRALALYLVIEAITPPPERREPVLRSFLSGPPIPTPVALGLALDIARGMSHATTLLPGLVHRDLKPENILVDHVGTARITDFGLAGVVRLRQQSQSDMTESFLDISARQVAGTPHYMAPEQARGHALDQRSDIFSFGCVLHDLFCGGNAWDVPYIRSDNQGLSHHGQGHLRHTLASVARPIRSLITACLELDPANRPATWTEVVDLVINTATTCSVTLAPPRTRVTGHDENAEQAKSLLDLAIAYFDVGNFSQATEFVGAVAQTATIGRHQRVHIRALELGGKIAVKRGAFDEAFAAFNQALKLAVSSNDTVLEKTITNNIGLVLLDLGHLDEARKYFERALELSRALPVANDEATILNNLGLIAHRLGRSKQALEHFSSFFAMARANQDRLLSIKALGNIAYALNEIGDHHTSIGLFQCAYTWAVDCASLADQCEILGNLGHAYRWLEAYDDAIYAFECQLHTADQLANPAERARALHGIATCYFERRQFDHAWAVAHESLGCCQNTGDVHAEAHARSLLGAIDCRRGKRIEGLKNLDRALTIYRDLGDHANAEGTIAFIEENRRDLGQHANDPNTRKLLDRARVIDSHISALETSGDWPAMLSQLYKAGKYYAKATDLVTARERFETGVRLAGSREIDSLGIELVDALITTCVEQEDWESAAVASDTLLAWLAVCDSDGDIVVRLEKVSRVFAMVGRIENALHTSQRAVHLAYSQGALVPYVRTTVRLASQYLVANDLESAKPYIAIVESLLDQLHPDQTYAEFFARVADQYARHGLRNQAASYCSIVVNVYRQLGNHEAAARAENLGVAFKYELPINIPS